MPENLDKYERQIKQESSVGTCCIMVRVWDIFTQQAFESFHTKGISKRGSAYENCAWEIPIYLSTLK